MEICPICAAGLWPHEIINDGAKALATRLMPVPDLPMNHAVHVLDQ